MATILGFHGRIYYEKNIQEKEKHLLRNAYFQSVFMVTKQKIQKIISTHNLNLKFKS